MTEPTLDFGGESYDRERDGKRLYPDLIKLRSFMLRHQNIWFTPQSICTATGKDWATTSARLRDLRKKKFGGYTIERRYLKDGLWEYRMGESNE